jgi:hypothetical protein
MSTRSLWLGDSELFTDDASLVDNHVGLAALAQATEQGYQSRGLVVIDRANHLGIARMRELAIALLDERTHPCAHPKELEGGRSITADNLVGPLAGMSMLDLHQAMLDGRACVNVHTL